MIVLSDPTNASIRTAPASPKPTALTALSNRVCSVQSSPRRLDVASSPATPPAQNKHIQIPLYYARPTRDADQIKDLDSFSEIWGSLYKQLTTQTLSERDVLDVLKSGILQRRVGSNLAPVFVDAIMRSVRPVGDMTVARLRESVDAICHLSPDRWAVHFGEHLNFSESTDGPGMADFIQKQLTKSRKDIDKKIASGVLLTNAQWHSLCEIIEQRPLLKEQLGRRLQELDPRMAFVDVDDIPHIRPSLDTAQFFLSNSLQVIREHAVHDSIPDAYEDKIRQLMRCITQATDSTRENGCNEGETARLEFLEQGRSFRLLKVLEEIERKSDFHDSVVASGPRVPQGFAGKLVFALNLVNVVQQLPPPTVDPVPEAAADEKPSFASDATEQFEQFAWQADALLTEITHILTGWSPVAANDGPDPRPLLRQLVESLNEMDVRTPLRDIPHSSYGAPGNPYATTTASLTSGNETPEEADLETLGARLGTWLSSVAGYLGATGATLLTSAAGAVQHHPRAAATVALVAIHAAVNEFYARWFPDSAGAQAKAVHPPVNPDAEWVEQPGSSAHEYSAHLQMSKHMVDISGNGYIEVEYPLANSEGLSQAEPVDKGTHRVIETVIDTDTTSQADRTLQAAVLLQLESNQNTPLPVTSGSLIEASFDLYRQTLNDAKVLAWFESKGLVLDTLIIKQNSVSGNVTRDGVSGVQTFSVWDTSGWWQVCAQVRAASELLDPTNVGLPYVSEDRRLIPRDVILDFYREARPTSEQEASAIAQRLESEGWPEISAAEKDELDKEVKGVKELMREAKARVLLTGELEKIVGQKTDNEIISLSGQRSESADSSPLAHKSLAILHYLNDFFELPEMLQVCNAQNLDGRSMPVRISDNRIQALMQSGHWYDLTDLVEEQPALKAPFNDLLQMVKETGGALYSPLSFDLQQILAFAGFGAPQTAGEVRNVIRWLQTSLPPAMPLGDFGAQLLLDTGSPVALTPSDRTKIVDLVAGFHNGFASIIDALGAERLLHTTVEYRRNNADELLGELFEKDLAVSWGHGLLQALNWYGADQAAVPEHYEKLLLAAIKLAIDPDAPGKPGTIAGYEIYQPANLGRDLKVVRAEIEYQLIEQKGVSAQAAPLIAHLFLADAAPEFLAQDAGAQILVGTASWMTLRLGVAIAEATAPGCSRAMTTDQLRGLALLAPTTDDQQQLFKTLAVDIVTTWGVMNGVIQQRGESAYSPQDYSTAASKFATQRAELSQALDGFKRELVTRKQLATLELGKVFSRFTQVPIDQLMIETYKPWLDANPNSESTKKSLVEAYMDGDLFKTSWQLSDETILLWDGGFDGCLTKLPDLNALLTASVDSFFNERKQSFITSTKALFATLPLEDRQCLEWGEVKLFTLREETGKLKEDETPSMRAAFRGRQGTLLRCEYGQTVSYFEVFPGRLSIIKRTDLPDDLPLNGVIKIEKAKISKGSSVNVDVQRGTTLPFDFAAYAQGTEPTTGAQSEKLIIEQLGHSLPGGTAQRNVQTVHVPDTYFSNKTARITNGIVIDNLLEGEQEFLLKKAKGQTTSEENLAYREKIENFLLQLIPFVGCTDDLSSGDRIRFINGAFGCFADLVSGLGTLAGGVGKVSNVLKSVAPISVKVFEAMRITGNNIVSVINPLDGVPDLVAGGARALHSVSRIVKSGVFTLTQTGIARLQTCANRLRGFFGGAATGAASIQLSHRINALANGVAGTINGTSVTAIQASGKWYALDNNGHPMGPPIEHFIALPTPPPSRT
ncbi:hypothetical protein [Pseudomonas sp. QTF5]|uniref:hypothetical protein n=1 Tax=Pseudomonas sp. QTF5 TaxID=1435425 RepID=UPI0004B55E94|nr:hypothetical protein [Pseudomonas sp. QTF5]